MFFSKLNDFSVKFSAQYLSGQIDTYESIVFYAAYTSKHLNYCLRLIKVCLWNIIHISICLLESCLMLCVNISYTSFSSKHSHVRKCCLRVGNSKEQHILRVRYMHWSMLSTPPKFGRSILFLSDVIFILLSTNFTSFPTLVQVPCMSLGRNCAKFRGLTANFF